jgi:hypothetical protein
LRCGTADASWAVVRPAPIPLALLLAGLLTVPVTAAAQQDERPKTGKIDGVERERDRADRTSDDDEGGFFAFEFIGNVFGGLFGTPRGPALGYLRHPYARTETGTAFVRDSAMAGYRHNTVTGVYFDDARSTLRAGIITFETVNSDVALGFEYAGFTEPLADETDRLHLGRAGIAGIGGGAHSLFRFGAGLRLLVLDDGDAAGGWDVELGTLVFPKRPLSVGVTFRGGQLWWDEDSKSWLGDLNVTAGIHTGPAELQIGWRWVAIEHVPSFGGPTIGLRFWF